MAGKPYETPSSTTEQILNLCWRIAVELRAIYNTAKARLTQAEADNLYLGKAAKAESAKTADSAGSASQDGQGRVITSTYLTKADASTTYLGKSDKAASASAADTAASATKAVQDGAGNVITTTYAKKAEVSAQVNPDWAATSGKAQILNKPTLGKLAAKDSVAYSEVTGTPSLGTLASMSALDYSSNYLLNKPTIPTVSTAGKTGSYTDLSNKPAVLSVLGYDAESDKITASKGMTVNGSAVATDQTLSTYTIPWSRVTDVPDSVGSAAIENIKSRLDTLEGAGYITSATADGKYLGKTAKATSATKADSATSATSATKATQDASGNVITSTYATKTELTTGLAKVPTITSGTEDMTAGTSALATGALYFVYE